MIARGDNGCAAQPRESGNIRIVISVRVCHRMAAGRVSDALYRAESLYAAGAALLPSIQGSINSRVPPGDTISKPA